MSGLFGELNRTAQALAAQSQGIFTAGRNMANVNNPAYARQRVVLGDKGTAQTPLGPRSLGVEALYLQNVRDKLLDTQVLRETAFMKSLEAEVDAYFKAEIAIGQQIDTSGESTFIEGAAATGSSHGVGEAMDSFFNAFSALAASPRSAAEKQSLFQQAQTLVSRFNRADGRLSEIQTDLDAQVQADVDRVNSILETIQSLNQQIGRFEVGKPGTALDLRDQRQSKLEELSGYLDVEVQDISDSAGQIRILSRNGAGDPVTLLDGARDFNPLAFDGASVTGGEVSVALDVRGGSIAGSLVARDGAIAQMRTGLDQLARQLAVSVNAAYNPGGASTDFFDAAGLTAATIRLDGALASDNVRASATGDPGANEIALAVSGLSTRVFATASGDGFNGTFGSFYRSLVSDLGNAASSANSRFEDQATLQRLVLDRRDAVSGVSLDEEMTDLMKFQRAFDANARVLRAIDDMLEIVVRELF
jgi:flagellar hook-associated protein 1 FlgK